MNHRKARLYAHITRIIFTLLTALSAWAFAVSRELTAGIEAQVPFIPYYYTVPRSVEYIAAGVLLYLLFSAVLTFALTSTDT